MLMPDTDQLCTLLDEMTASLSSTRQAIQTVSEKLDVSTQDGISLLSFKSYTLLSYIHALTLLVAHRVFPSATLVDHSPPARPFSSSDRPARGVQAGDLVDACVEGRVVLEKIKTMEERLRYQIEKLIKAARDEDVGDKSSIIEDPLVFRPNPQNLVDANGGDGNAEPDGTGKQSDTPTYPNAHSTADVDRFPDDEIYHPPKLAPMPYTGTISKGKSQRRPVPSALASLLHSDPTRPYLEASTGLGSAPALDSRRDRAVRRYTEFEEENFTRLVMKKRDMRRRAREEEALALGGSLSAGRGKRGGGFEGEFADLLKGVGKSKKDPLGDGYEELRARGKKEGVLERSRRRTGEEAFEAEVGRDKKKGRFEKATKFVNKKLSKEKRAAKA